MPILSIQFGGEATDPSGNKLDVPGNLVLFRSGPCMQVSISVAEPVAVQLLQQGKKLPAPISGMALVDTGASTTCIDETVAQKLLLPVTDVVMVASASHAATQQNVYPARIEVVGLSIAINALNAIGAPLAPQGIIALIGRDVLQHCTLFYNGMTGSISLAM